MLFKKGGKKIDKLITSVLIGGAVASVFGISKKLRNKKKITKAPKSFFGGVKEDIGDLLVKIVNIFSKK